MKLRQWFLSVFILSFSSFVIASEQLIIEPEAGRAPILSAITQAKSSIDLIIYGLTDEQFIQALVRAKNEGKNVQVLMEPQPYKSEKENDKAFHQLRAANILLQTPNPDMKLTHQKTILIDNKQAIVMTFNLTHSSFKKERNFALVIDNPAMIQEISSVFEADSKHHNIAVKQPRLIWSPQNSREKIIDFIKSAQSEIKIYAQDITDYQLIGTLARVARSGINIKILMSKPQDVTNKKLAFLRHAGVEIHFGNQYLIHAKVIIVDNKKAILGSINFTRPSFNDNRELAVISNDSNVINGLVNTFTQDWCANPDEQNKYSCKKTPVFSHKIIKELIYTVKQIIALL